MAGFQKFPVKRTLVTRAYWPWVPNWKSNTAMIMISTGLISFAFWRFMLIRSVRTSIKYSNFILELETMLKVAIRMPLDHSHSD